MSIGMISDCAPKVWVAAAAGVAAASTSATSVLLGDCARISVLVSGVVGAVACLVAVVGAAVVDEEDGLELVRAHRRADAAGDHDRGEVVVAQRVVGDRREV